MAIRPSPVVALNRAIAVAQLKVPSAGSKRSTPSPTVIASPRYPFYSAALGELELRRGRHEIAREHFHAALALSAQPHGTPVPSRVASAPASRALPSRHTTQNNKTGFSLTRPLTLVSARSTVGTIRKKGSSEEIVGGFRLG